MAMNAKSSRSALEGILVVELGSRIGAGVCGSLLSQVGATVVLVEPLAEGAQQGKWRFRAQFAAGKRSIDVDPDRAGDVSLLERLIATADVLVLSSDADGTSQTRAAAHAAPSSIVCDVTAFGATGPLSGTAATEQQVQALTGIMATTGEANGPPAQVRFPIVEFMTGVYAAASVLAALRVRARCGAGQAIDMALFDCGFAAMSTFLPNAFAGVDAGPVERVGNRHAMIAPWNIYRTLDGWLLLCANSDQQWRRLCQMMGKPGLADEIKHMTDRVRRVEEVDAAVQQWIDGQTMASAQQLLGTAGISCGPVAPLDQHPQEENLEYRGMIGTVFDPVLNKTIFLPASPFRTSVSAQAVADRIPAPGQDREMLCGLAARGPSAAHQQAASRTAQGLPLEGVRVLEIGHYTTVPLCTRHLASLGAEVIKIEPPVGDPVRSFPPIIDGIGLYFQSTNAGKRSVVIDLETAEGADALRRLVAESDVVIENLKPGALARRGFSWDAMRALNPRIVYCSVSGFGVDSLYSGRPAVDSVIQAMSGMMDVNRADGIPMKTGISAADILGAEVGLFAVIAALALRDRHGEGQQIDISMQDVSAWASQTLWNRAGGAPATQVLAGADGFMLDQLGSGATPILRVKEVAVHPQTAARKLWFYARSSGTQWPILASPMRLLGTPVQPCMPMAALGADTDAVMRSLKSAAQPQSALGA